MNKYFNFLCFHIFMFSCFHVFVFSYFHVFIFSYFHIFMFSCFRIFIFSRFHIFTFSHFHVFIFSCFHIFMFSYFHIFIFLCFHIFIFSYFHVFIFSCFHIFMFSYFHVFIFSYFHVFIFSCFHIFIFSCFRVFVFSECNNLLTSFSGVIESPNFPNAYPHNRNCTWVIQTTLGNTVNASFSHFDIESHSQCRYDRLQVCQSSLRHVSVTFHPHPLTVSVISSTRVCHIPSPPTYCVSRLLDMCLSHSIPAHLLCQSSLRHVSVTFHPRPLTVSVISSTRVCHVPSPPTYCVSRLLDMCLSHSIPAHLLCQLSL